MEDSTLDFYNQNADIFFENTKDIVFTEIQDRFLKYLPEGASILDLGCGSGRDTKYFIRNGYQVDAMDGSAKLCKIASEFTGIKVKQMLFQDLNIIETYHGIWACSSILHLTVIEIEELFHKIAKALKPNGIFYTSFKYGTFKGIRNGRYFTDMNECSFRDLLSDIEEFVVLEQWISKDVRPERDEKWLNIILKKR